MHTDLPEIKGFLETSFLDWPGKVASVVFLAGCNFRCPYCHNHRLVVTPGTLGTWPAEAILDRLEEFRGWIDGVCVTGGEPTLHPTLPALLGLFRERALGIKLDTNGSRPGVLAGLLNRGMLDAVALDVKAPLEPIPYRRNGGAGADHDAVRESLRLLAPQPIPLELRTTIHPALLSREELCRLAGQVAELAGDAGPRVFTPQLCRVSEVLDPDLATRPSLDHEVFATWKEEAVGVFQAARLRRFGKART